MTLTKPDGGLFELDLFGSGSRVKLNGRELEHVRDIKVHQPTEGPLTVTIEFLASEVKGFDSSHIRAIETMRAISERLGVAIRRTRLRKADTQDA